MQRLHGATKRAQQQLTHARGPSGSILSLEMGITYRYRRVLRDDQ